MRHTFTLILVASVLLAGCSREGADWTAAQSANTIESYQEFLRQHPDSAHGLQAQASVNQLTEDRDWQQAAAADTREAYEGFVAAHADSKWAQEARVRVENLALGGSSTAAQPAAAGPETDAAATVPGSTAAPAATSTPAPAAAKSAAPVAMKPATKPAAAAAKPAAPVATKPAPVAAAAASAPTAKGSQLVQFGAFSTRERAAAQWKTLLAKESQLKGVEPRYASGSANGKKLYRLQASLASPAKARELCAALKARSQSCLLVQR